MIYALISAAFAFTEQLPDFAVEFLENAFRAGFIEHFNHDFKPPDVTPPSPPDIPPSPPSTPPTPPDTPYVLDATRTPQVLGASRAQTGDDSDLQLWVTLMMASAAGLLAAFKKRRKAQED